MEKIEARKYEVPPGESLFFDTNIWLIINGPMADSKKALQNVYGGILRDAVSRGASIFICSSVISEYINVVLKIGYKKWLEANSYKSFEKDFKKDYRPTQDYADQLEDAKQQIQEILSYKCVERLPDDFNAVPILPIIISRMNNSCDYNDSYYLYLCDKCGAKMVSDDSDFAALQSKVKLITGR